MFGILLFFGLAATAFYKSQTADAAPADVESTNPFLSVFSTNRTISSYGIEQTNDTHLWFSGITTDTAGGDQDIIFGEIVNGTLLSTLKLTSSGDEFLQDFVQTNDTGLAFTGWTSTNNKAILGKLRSDNKSLSWIRVFGGVNNDYATSLLTRNGGGFVLIGQTTSFGAGNLDIFVTEFDHNGNVLLAKTIGGLGDEASYSLKQTKDGGYVAAGYSGSFGAGGLDLFIYKLDNNLNLLWAKVLGGINYDVAYSVVEKNDGHLVMVGFTTGFGAVGQALLIAEVDSDGNFLSAKIIDGPGDEVGFAVQKTNNGIKLGGYTTSYGSGNPKKMFIVDLDENNTLVSAVTIEGDGNDAIYDIKSTNGGGFAFTGQFNQSAVIARTDINGSFASNCTTDVIALVSVADTTENITVSTPNITGIPFTLTFYNLTFTSNPAPLTSQKPCELSPPPTVVSTITPTPNPTQAPVPIPTPGSTRVSTPLPASMPTPAFASTVTPTLPISTSSTTSNPTFAPTVVTTSTPKPSVSPSQKGNSTWPVMTIILTGAGFILLISISGLGVCYRLKIKNRRITEKKPDDKNASELTTVMVPNETVNAIGNSGNNVQAKNEYESSSGIFNSPEQDSLYGKISEVRASQQFTPEQLYGQFGNPPQQNNLAANPPMMHQYNTLITRGDAQNNGVWASVVLKHN